MFFSIDTKLKFKYSTNAYIVTIYIIGLSWCFVIVLMLCYCVLCFVIVFLCFVLVFLRFVAVFLCSVIVLLWLCYCLFRMVQVQDIPVHKTRAQNQICVEHPNQSPQSQVQCPSPKTHLAPFSLTSQICSIIPIYMQGEGRQVPLPLLPQLQPGIPMWQSTSLLNQHSHSKITETRKWRYCNVCLFL